ncbi:MAG: O-antigen ligase family protein [Chloroflexi bacterium]|nr:O-antigen ligase family protein [Chloroflexota bacterium]
MAGLVLLILLTATNVLPGAWADRLVAVLDNFGVFDVRTAQITPENFAVVERMAHWQAGWGMFLEQPWLGVGAGNYPARYEEYMMPGWVQPLGHAHNYYLNMAAETGIVGLLALVGALATVFRAIAGGLKRAALGSESRALLTGLLGSLTVLMVHNLFDNLLVHGMAVQIGALAGLVVAVASQSSESVPPQAVSGHAA